MKKINDSFILNLWERIFFILSYVSIFSLIRLIVKKVSYSFVEFWVLSNTIFAFLSIIIVYYLNPNYKITIWIVMIYGALRIFEIINYQINVLLFDPYKLFAIIVTRLFSLSVIPLSYAVVSTNILCSGFDIFEK